ncbi:hypothetical protein ACFDAU_12490 [Sulfuriferula sp. GW1]|uniref:hypothetical protein n=1 Tax=Sulfuriferula sp. GW1 TaxID=3345111 RepID=UPI0039AF713F
MQDRDVLYGKPCIRENASKNLGGIQAEGILARRHQDKKVGGHPPTDIQLPPV